MNRKFGRVAPESVSDGSPTNSKAMAVSRQRRDERRGEEETAEYAPETLKQRGREVPRRDHRGGRLYDVQRERRARRADRGA